jgi:peptidoglycan/xylan/chitin deacetylase (PgdA/CDA1 family)
MLRLTVFLAVLAAPAAAAPHLALDQPILTLPPSHDGVPRVALTLDACDGLTDHRILDLLVARNVPATIFATGKWIARNPKALAEMLGHPDLFEIEDHGARHVPAIERPMTLFGLRAAGSAQAVQQEVSGGAAALTVTGTPPPQWFRGAGAEYDAGAEADIRRLGYRLAGFSVNADQGASLSEASVRRRFDKTPDGAVIIAHINQPHRPAGAGVAEGIADLLGRGYRFVRLEDALPSGGQAGW